MPNFCRLLLNVSELLVGEIILVSYKSNNLFLLPSPNTLVLYPVSVLESLVKVKYLSSLGRIPVPCLLRWIPKGLTAAWAKVLVGK